MKNVKKIVACMIIVLLSCGIIFGLSRQSGLKNKAENVKPPLFDTPSYIELNDGETILVALTADTDCRLGSFTAVLVNTDTEGTGTIEFLLTTASGEVIFDQTVQESAVSVGEWTELGTPDFDMVQGESYKLFITANGCDPYFIKTQKEATNKVLPFSETVYTLEADAESDISEELDNGISIGTSIVTDEVLTYGEIFYFSIPLVIIFAMVLILLVLFGVEGAKELLSKVAFDRFIVAAGNEIFLVVLFVSICFSIWVNGYLEGINISADSAGYLREAVNMAAGNGFRYDGLAGYSDTWFANWPILYPMLIAIVMKITGAEVYLASKILSMILVGVLILIIRCVYKKDAWFYALFMSNLGLMYLYWYSWSELPFIVFMVLFVISLSSVIKDAKVKIINYVFLGLTIAGCFLTRYFGMFCFGVMGFYILELMLTRLCDKDLQSRPFLTRLFSKQIIALIITSVVSGLICLGYLINNKIQNGMPSGVSRSMWWDDYQSLTNDLIKALLAEFFDVFHIDTPSFVSGLSYDKATLLVILIVALLALFVVKKCRRHTRASVYVTTGVIYYGMFIVIRYFSSMDTFYYRFFAPATFLITLGIAELIFEGIQGKKAAGYILTGFTLLFLIFACSDLTDHIMKDKLSYYDIIQMSWDEDYAEIPDHSVVIFSTLDYRSLYYRADVVEGTINPDDTMDSLKERYYGSNYMCILTDDAVTMLEADFYDDSIEEAIDTALQNAGKYCIIELAR